jgi:hypothetical protein
MYFVMGVMSAFRRRSGWGCSIGLTAAAMLSACVASAEEFPSIAQHFPVMVAQLPPSARSSPTTAPAGEVPRALPPVENVSPQSAPQAAGAGAGTGTAADDAGIPDLRRELADTDVGGLRESLSSVPSMVGDGCNPGGAGSGGKVTIDRLVIFGSGLTLSGKTLSGGPTGVIYEAPQIYRDIQSLPPNGQIPGAIPVGAVAGTPSFQANGIPPGGANTIVGPSAGYAPAVNTDLKQTFVNRTGVDNGEVTFTPTTSGALATSTAGQYDAFAYYNYVVDAASTTPGLNVGFVKLAENVSPMPRDRVFFNMSYFHNSFFSQNVRADINRFMPGFEKTGSHRSRSAPRLPPPSTAPRATTPQPEPASRAIATSSGATCRSSSRG